MVFVVLVALGAASYVQFVGVFKFLKAGFARFKLVY